jgi:hypothetical protein
MSAPYVSPYIWIVCNHQGPIQSFRDRSDADAFVEQFRPLGVPLQVFSCALVERTV